MRLLVRAQRGTVVNAHCGGSGLLSGNTQADVKEALQFRAFNFGPAAVLAQLQARHAFGVAEEVRVARVSLHSHPLDVILTFATPSTFHGVAKHAIFAGVQRQHRSAPAVLCRKSPEDYPYNKYGKTLARQVLLSWSIH